MTDPLEDRLNSEQKSILESLTTPYNIQSFLDSIPYSAENVDRCPLEVIQDRKAHCLDGGLFAAACLRRLGYPPLVVDLLPEPGTDDDHILAIFKQNGHFGAVAKSNFVGLRYREAIYRNLRELVMSYFEQFYNINRQKTLRLYTRPVNLAIFDHLEWTFRSDHLEEIEHYLERIRRYPVITTEMAGHLSLIDKRSYEAGLEGSLHEGLYQPVTS
jgi:hypothetical protein